MTDVTYRCEQYHARTYETREGATHLRKGIVLVPVHAAYGARDTSLYVQVVITQSTRVDGKHFAFTATDSEYLTRGETCAECRALVERQRETRDVSTRVDVEHVSSLDRLDLAPPETLDESQLAQLVASVGRSVLDGASAMNMPFDTLLSTVVRVLSASESRAANWQRFEELVRAWARAQRLSHLQ